MRSFAVLLFLVILIHCSARPQQSVHSASRAKRSSECVDLYDQYYCNYWRSQGYCHPSSYYYNSMKNYCKKTCGLCVLVCQDKSQYCSSWNSLGYCQLGHYYYPSMIIYCPVTCRVCEPPKTTAAPATTAHPATTAAPGTTAHPATTAKPGTTANPATTVKPGTTANPATTAKPGTTANPATTAKPGTTANPATTAKPGTTANPATTAKPGTTANPATTAAPGTTANPVTVTDAPSTTDNPSTTESPSTTANPSTTNAPPTPAENTCLKGHNNRRALHGASQLVWNDTLVQHAQVWANHLAASGVVEHDPNRNGEGENIAWFKGHDSADCTNALVGWYDNEEPQYNYNNPGFTPETGHFTQVVWKSTTSVGVAQASTGSGLSKQIYIVARYYPTGNIKGFFSQNVGNKISP